MQLQIIDDNGEFIDLGEVTSIEFDVEAEGQNDNPPLVGLKEVGFEAALKWPSPLENYLHFRRN